MGRIPDHVRQQVIDWPADAGRGAVQAFCAEHGVSRSWFYSIRRLAAEHGQAAMLKESTRPARSPGRLSQFARQAVLAERRRLQAEGKDHGAESVLFSLHRKHRLDFEQLPSRSSVVRIFDQAQVVARNRRKRPKRAYRRFAAQFPNQRWQADAFEYWLSTGESVVIIEILDDATRYSLATSVAASESSPAVVQAFSQAIQAYGRPVLVHTDNGGAFNATRRNKTNALVQMLHDLGINTITGRPSTPQSQGKVERSHQTIQQYLQAHPCADRQQLEAVLADYRHWYNHHRAHQSLGRSTTPADLYETQPKIAPPAGPIYRSPAPAPSLAPVEADSPVVTTRRVGAGARGLLYYRDRSILCGSRYSGQLLHLIEHSDRLEIFDAQGTFLTEIAWPPRAKYPGISSRLP